jgi:hypothetical protein
MSKYLLNKNHAVDLIKQHFVPKLLAPSQYETNIHLHLSNHYFLKPNPETYEESLIEDDLYELDYLETSLDERITIFEKHRPIKTKPFLKTFARRLRDYRITYLGYWYRRRKIIAARTLKRKFNTFRLLRRRIFTGLFREKMQKWIFKKTRLPIKMISKQLALWRDTERTSFFSFRAGERMHYYMRTYLRYGRRSSLFYAQNFFPGMLHPDNMDITSSMHWQLYRPLSLRRRLYTFFKRTFWLIYRRYFSDRYYFMFGTHPLQMRFHDFCASPKLPYMPILRMPKLNNCNPPNPNFEKIRKQVLKRRKFVRKYRIKRKKLLLKAKKKFFKDLPLYRYKKIRRYQQLSRDYKKAQRKLYYFQKLYPIRMFIMNIKLYYYIFLEHLEAFHDRQSFRLLVIIERLQSLQRLYYALYKLFKAWKDKKTK